MDAVKIWHHGDFHLGQMLVVKDDVFIIDLKANRGGRSSAADARQQRHGTLPVSSARSTIEPAPHSPARSARRLTRTAGSHGRWNGGATGRSPRPWRRIMKI